MIAARPAASAITFARVKDAKLACEREYRAMKNDHKFHGGCHCGAVAFEVTGTIELLDECNCSICAKKGYLHWIVPREAFRLLTPEKDLATYSFQHRSCEASLLPAMRRRAVLHSTLGPEQDRCERAMPRRS
ncbi:MAG: hypothetical protein WA854_04575 [Candidatus Binataceae bacterium]